MRKQPAMSFDITGEKHRPDLKEVPCRDIQFVTGQKMDHFSVRDLANIKHIKSYSKY